MRKILIGEISDVRFQQLKEIIANEIRSVNPSNDEKKVAAKILKMFMFSKK